MSLTRARYRVYSLSASSRAVDLSLSFVCVLWEPDPSLEPMGVLHRGSVVEDWEGEVAHQEVSRELESVPKHVISVTAWITSSGTVLGWMNM